MIEDIGRARKGKPFRKADLVVYGLIALLVIGLFVAFVFTRTDANATEIIAERNGERVFTYSFADGSLTLNEEYSGIVEYSDLDGGYTITIFTDKKRSAFNTVVIESGGKTYISDADCSNRKDCAHMKAIDAGGGTIICVPHGLKIYATGDYSPTLG